jgi:L-lysine 6-oxidase
MSLSIHPSVGIPRLGNSTTEICIAPDHLGGLPYDADYYGNIQGIIKTFKDDAGRIKRQGQLFHLMECDGTEITLDTPGVDSIEWTVHLANKKAAWYQYSELEGNLLYGQDNSYQARNVPFRNPDVPSGERQKLIVDPGPRSISGRQQRIGFDKSSVPTGYPAQFPSETVMYGTPVVSLGELRTDAKGRLIVLGGFGHAGGNEPLTSYGGSNTWHDDISDGPIYCRIIYNDGSPSADLKAWAIVGSPDFAPEIVNITNLSDTMFDVAVRNFNLVPEMCLNGVWNDNYVANFKRDILPLIERISRYQWVSNVQSMSAFFAYKFDFADPSKENEENRLNYFSYFRRPDQLPPSGGVTADQPQQQLFRDDQSYDFPMMPLNSGSNSVSNINIEKFLALDETQFFLLGQWAKGSFENTSDYPAYPVDPADAASVGNCVGLPMCPGIEVTWSLQNPAVYESAYVIGHFQNEEWYQENGLSPSRDECEGGGVEPGDLTKRMACPWQADFFQCTVQYINFTDPSLNKDGSPPMPKPPTYYSYWWPPQSPWDVLAGETSVDGQALSHLPAGEQVNYARGINSFVQMVEYWYSLGFIRNQNVPGQPGFPYFVETERNHELFSYQEVPVSQITGNPQDRDTTIPVFFIESQNNTIQERSIRAQKLVSYLEERAFKAIEIASQGIGAPRSGTRARR